MQIAFGQAQIRSSPGSMSTKSSAPKEALERVACLLHTDSDDSMCRSSMPQCLAVLQRCLGLASFRVHGRCSEKDELISDAATLESFQLLKVPFGPSNCTLSIDTKGYRVAVT